MSGLGEIVEGVTPVARLVLDRVAEMRGNGWSQFAHLTRAVQLTKKANAAWAPRPDATANAMEAAAHLIRAAELGDEG